MAIVAAGDGHHQPVLPIANTATLVFPENEGWLGQIAYAPEHSRTLFWDLGYLFDELKCVHEGLEFKQIMREMRDLAHSLQLQGDLHLRGNILRPAVKPAKKNVVVNHRVHHVLCFFMISGLLLICYCFTLSSWFGRSGRMLWTAMHVLQSFC